MRNKKLGNRLTTVAWMLATALTVGLPQLATAQTVLRIGMTAADIPRTLGQPDQGFEGNRFTARFFRNYALHERKASFASSIYALSKKMIRATSRGWN